MCHIQLQVREDAIRFHELFLCLAGESDDDIRRDGTIRNLRADLCHEVAVFLLGVSAFHIDQHFIIARLNGKFDVRHDARKFGDGLNEIIAKIIGMRSQEADALDAVDFMDEAQQRREVGTIGNILAVAIHDLTEQGHFFYALLRQRADLQPQYRPQDANVRRRVWTG